MPNVKDVARDLQGLAGGLDQAKNEVSAEYGKAQEIERQLGAHGFVARNS
jgi:hypothetical protein